MPNRPSTVPDALRHAALGLFCLLVGAPAASAAPASAPYPGYAYQLPAARPFISLEAYAAMSRGAAPVKRLKADVDDVVAVTRRLPAAATYGQLVKALEADHYAYTPVDAVVLYRLTGDTAYIDQAIRMVDLYVQSQAAAIAAGSAPSIAGDSYLEVGPRIAEVALAYDYGYARLTEAQRAAWSGLAEQAIANIWDHQHAKWGAATFPWTGWSTTDPGNNYFYSFMRATQLWALASQNPVWIKFLQTKVYPLLVPFFGAVAGGGSREGTGYGTAIAALFENYLYWKDSTGEDLAGYSSHARDTIDYWIHATVPTFDYFAPIGDQARSSMPVMFDYQRKLMLAAVALSPASEQGRRGAWWLNRAKVTDGGTDWLIGRMRYGFNFRYDLLAGTFAEQAPTALMYDAAGTGALFARSGWTTSASWMHTNAGVYDQSHAHQDQGAFSFYKGRWLTLTSNVYSHSGINQGTDVDNVVRFDDGSRPVRQNYSVSTKTVADAGDALRINEDLSPAYSASAGRVAKWTRALTYTRSKHTLLVEDRCQVGAGVTPVWQLHMPVPPVRQADGSYVAGGLRVAPLVPASPVAKVVEMASVSADFGGGYRLELQGPAGTCEFSVRLTAQ